MFWAYYYMKKQIKREIIIKDIISIIDKYAGKVFGIEVVVSDKVSSKDYVKGFIEGKKYIIKEIKTLLKY